MFVLSVFCCAGCKYSRCKACGDQENEVQIVAESVARLFIYMFIMKGSLYCVNCKHDRRDP